MVFLTEAFKVFRKSRSRDSEMSATSLGKDISVDIDNHYLLYLGFSKALNSQWSCHTQFYQITRCLNAWISFFLWGVRLKNLLVILQIKNLNQHHMGIFEQPFIIRDFSEFCMPFILHFSFFFGGEKKRKKKKKYFFSHNDSSWWIREALLLNSSDEQKKSNHQLYHCICNVYFRGNEPLS